MIYLQRLLYDTNNKYVATNVLTKLIFQDRNDWKIRTFPGPVANFRTSTDPNDFQDFAWLVGTL